MTSYHLILHEDLRAQINCLAAARNLMKVAALLRANAPAADAVRAPNAAGDTAARKNRGPSQRPLRGR